MHYKTVRLKLSHLKVLITIYQCVHTRDVDTRIEEQRFVKVEVKKSVKNIQQRGFASGHPPDY